MAFKKIVQASFFILCTLSLSAAMAEPIARMSDKGVKELGKTIAKQEKNLRQGTALQVQEKYFAWSNWGADGQRLLE